MHVCSEEVGRDDWRDDGREDGREDERRACGERVGEGGWEREDGRERVGEGGWEKEVRRRDLLLVDILPSQLHGC